MDDFIHEILKFYKHSTKQNVKNLITKLLTKNFNIYPTLDQQESTEDQR